MVLFAIRQLQMYPRSLSLNMTMLYIYVYGYILHPLFNVSCWQFDHSISLA